MAANYGLLLQKAQYTPVVRCQEVHHVLSCVGYNHVLLYSWQDHVSGGIRFMTALKIPINISLKPNYEPVPVPFASLL